MREDITHVALDAHMKMLQVAMLLPGSDVAIEWQVVNEAGAIRRMVKRILKEAKGTVRMCYEAGVIHAIFLPTFELLNVLNVLH